MQKETLKPITKKYWGSEGVLWTIYANKLDDLREMNKFLETCNPLRVNHEGTENVNRPMTSRDGISNLKLPSI